MNHADELFQMVPCPLCGSTSFAVRRAATYPICFTADDLKTIFSASSSHSLRDQVVECRTCSLTYINPRIKPELIAAGYSQAEDSTFVAQNDTRIVEFRRALRRILRREGISGAGKRVLDIGCAGGAFLVAARSFGLEAVGVEPSRWMAAWGRRTYGVDIRDGVLEAGTFPAGCFDMVTMWDVLEHVVDPHEVLTEIRRILRPDGLLIISYPDISSVAARVLGKRWPFWLSVHLLYYTPATIREQLQRAGFSLSWHGPSGMTLPCGYVARRAAAGWRMLRVAAWAVDRLGLSGVPLRYYMGQTLVVARSHQRA